jgi:hypothetical protein
MCRQPIAQGLHRLCIGQIAGIVYNGLCRIAVAQGISRIGQGLCLFGYKHQQVRFAGGSKLFGDGETNAAAGTGDEDNHAK